MIEEMKNIAKENAMQTQATILLAKEARRDSEIMKVIAFVTMIYLPATLMCVSRISCLSSSHCMLNVILHAPDCLQYGVLLFRL